MKIKSILSLAVAVSMLSAVSAFAEEEKKSFVDVSGKLFLDYSYLMDKKEKIAPNKSETKKQDSFNLTRAYVTFDKKFDDAWSAKVTLDAGSLDQTSKGDNKIKDSTGTETKNSVTTTTKSSSAFVKNAYGQYKTSLEPVELKVQAGLVGTPVIDLLDGVIGSRWIYQNYIDKSKDVTGLSLDPSSADTGIRAEVRLMKMVALTGMYSNGDGYKVNTSADQAPTTKSTYATLNITPIDALNLFGYYHSHNTAETDKSKNVLNYYGGGLGWKDKSFKVGGSYTISSGKTNDVKEKSSVIELWGNANTEEFVGVPVLLIGRLAKGTYELDADAGKQKNNGFAVWGGLGYQINKNVQIAAMYKSDVLVKKNSAGAKTSDAVSNTMYVKTEVVF